MTDADKAQQPASARSVVRIYCDHTRGRRPTSRPPELVDTFVRRDDGTWTTGRPSDIERGRPIDSIDPGRKHYVNTEDPTLRGSAPRQASPLPMPVGVDEIIAKRRNPIEPPETYEVFLLHCRACRAGPTDHVRGTTLAPLLDKSHQVGQSDIPLAAVELFISTRPPSTRQ